MMNYSLVRFVPREGLFVDTDNEQVATQEARDAYESGINADAFVLYKIVSDYDSEPTHIMLDGALYQLVEVEEVFVPTADEIAEMTETGICLECGAELDMCGHAEKFGIVIEIEDDEDES